MSQGEKIKGNKNENETRPLKTLRNTKIITTDSKTQLIFYEMTINLIDSLPNKHIDIFKSNVSIKNNVEIVSNCFNKLG